MQVVELRKGTQMVEGPEKSEGRKEGGRRERKWERGRGKEMKKERRERERRGGSPTTLLCQSKPFCKL